jgi:hypothetical protein
MEGQPGEPKYGVSMLFDAEAIKGPEFANMKKLAAVAAKEKFGDKLKSDGKGWFIGLRNPFRDGAEKADLEGYGEGITFCNATSKMKPGLVGAKMQKLHTEEDFYAGCYARATVVAYGYERAGNKGVSFGLNNLQKLRDGESLSGRVAAENDFDEVDTSAWDSDEKKDGDFLD